MPARPTRRRPTRLLAVGLLLLLVAPLAPPVQAQDGPVQDIFVKPGEVRIRQNNRDTQFLEPGPFRVEVKVYNIGPEVQVPIYFWVVNATTGNPRVDSIAPHCVNRVLERSGSGGEPSVTIVQWDVPDLPVSLPSRGYNVSIHVNTAAPTAAGFSQTDCRPDPATEGAIDRARNDANNRVRGYFVKDLRVDYKVFDLQWCAGEPGGWREPGNTTDKGCDDARTKKTAEGHPWNTTAPGPLDPAKNNTYFRAVVRNVGTWRDTVDFGGCHPDVTDRDRCPRFNVTARFTATGGNATETVPLTPPLPIHTNDSAEAFVQEYLLSKAFNLVDRAGNYTVNVTVNADNKFHDLDASNNTMESGFEIRWLDLAVEQGPGWRLSIDDPFDYGDGKRIVAKLNLSNRGTAWRNGTVTLNVGLDGVDKTTNPSCRFCSQEVKTHVAPGEEWSYEVNWSMSTDPTEPHYIRPGAHRVHAYVSEYSFYDPNETNDAISFDIYVRDISKPTFPAPIYSLRFGDYDTPQTLAIELNDTQPFNLFAFVGDEDPRNLTVIANFTSRVDANVSVVHHLFWLGIDNRFGVLVDNLTAVGNGSWSNWTLNLTARDVFGNERVSGPHNVRMRQWPIQTLPESQIVVGDRSTADNATFALDSGGSPEYWIRVHYNRTGIRDPSKPNDLWHPPGEPNESKFQHNHTGNLEIEITFADGKTKRFNATSGNNLWTNQTSCPVQRDPITGQTTEVCDPATFGLFKAVIPKTFEDRTLGQPGKWNVSLIVRDHAGVERRINRTLHVVDRIPEFRFLDVNLTQVLPGERFNVTANVTDDFRLSAAYVNFTRVSAGGGWANFTLSDPEEYTDQATGRPFFNYTLDLETGRGRMFGNAGTYEITFAAQDRSGNWASQKLARSLTLVDAEPPLLQSAGATPILQETGENVTFYARGDDKTNVTFTATVRLSSTETVELVLEPQLDGNATKAYAFPREGSYPFRIEAKDSAGYTSSGVEGIISVRDNLGPRYDLVRPAAFVEGTRYGQAAQRLEVNVYDSDGVLEENITLAVNGEPVADFQKTPMTGVRGFVLTADLGAGRRLAHGATVQVNVSAIDGSAAGLPSWLNFSFVVDDVAPSARVQGYDPKSYAPDQDRTYVSPDTLYSFVASDEDGLPTTVASLRYRVYGPGLASLDEVYDGPFRLSRAFGDDLRPGAYQIQYFAEDTVGNVNRTAQTLTVYVDNTPPSRDPYGAEPSGRHVNLTIVDDQSGVDRAVVWHRVNNGTWGQTSMAQDGNVWRAVLPEGRKGDRISYYAQAWDRVNNTATIRGPDNPIGVYEVPNHKPTLRITAPLQGDRFQRERDVTWEAFDADGDALSFEVSIRSSGSPAFSEIARPEGAARSYRLDSRTYSDGDYTLRVRAFDGEESAVATVNFTIRNSESAIGEVKAARTELLPGDATLLTAVIRKADTTAVEARLVRDGVLAATFPMRDDGTGGDETPDDGVYSATISVEDAGAYRVDVFTKYREGGVERNATYENVASFSVALTPGYVASQYWPLLVLLGVAGAAAIGVAAWAALRRR